MTPCSRESDVLDLVAIGQWPSRADAGLMAHVRSCARCADLAIVASAILDLRDQQAPVHLPDAGLVWFRAQVQARADAARRAARPLLFAQVAGVVAAAAILALWSGGLMGSLSFVATSSWSAAGDLVHRTSSLFEESRANTPGVAGNVLTWTVAAFAGGTLAVVGLALGLSRLADGEQ